jgi:hypothetical protein
MTNLAEKLADAKAEVTRLERAMQHATCVEAGHHWKFLGGRNAGCHRDCSCSVDVHVCTRCGDCDYGDTPEAVFIMDACREINGEWEDVA